METNRIHDGLTEAEARDWAARRWGTEPLTTVRRGTAIITVRNRSGRTLRGRGRAALGCSAWHEAVLGLMLADHPVRARKGGRA